MSRRVNFFGIYLGNLFEHYDTALFSFLSPYFATIFFPNEDYLTALIMTFGIIPLSRIARPIGSLFFGYIGDVYGRMHSLFFSLLGMSIITSLMGLLPTYHQAGITAPLLLLLARVLQNFFAAGENIVGAIYFLEDITEERKKDMTSSIYDTSTIAGILLASGLVALLYHFQFIEHGWRILYFIGLLTAIVGVILRKKANFKTVGKSHPNLILRLKMIWISRKTVITIMFATGFSYATYAMAFVLMNAFVPLVSDITKIQITKLNTIFLIFDLITLPLFGSLTRWFSRSSLMACAALLAFLTGIPLFSLLDHCSFLILIFVRVSVVLIGVCFSATYYSWAQNLIPKSHRYMTISFASALGSQILGGATTAISLWLYQQTHIISSVAWYWAVLGCVTSYLILNHRDSRSVVAIS